MSEIKIKTMTPADIDFTLALTGAEQWSNVRADFARLIALDTDGCFVADLDNDRVGMITTVCYRSLAFIGNLIVSSDRRGHGIGRKLMEHALTYLDRKMVETIELDGDYPAVTFYRTLGFKDKYLSLRFFRGRGDRPPALPPPTLTPDEFAAFDSELGGIDRSAFIKMYAGDNRDRLYAGRDRDGRINAALAIKEGPHGACQIGPLGARNSDQARELFENILVHFSSETVYFGMPEINREAVSMALENGFLYNPPSLRMYRGRYLDHEANSYAIISGDVG